MAPNREYRPSSSCPLRRDVPVALGGEGGLYGTWMRGRTVDDGSTSCGGFRSRREVVPSTGCDDRDAGCALEDAVVGDGDMEEEEKDGVGEDGAATRR